MKLLHRLSDGLYAVVLWIGILSLIAMTGIVCANIVARFVFNSSIDWGEEISRFLMIWAAMCGAVLAVRAGAHFRMDFVGQFKLESGLLKALPGLAAIVIGALLAVQGTTLTLLAHDQIATASEIRMSIPYVCLPIGGAIMMLFGLEAALVPPAAAHAPEAVAE